MTNLLLHSLKRFAPQFPLYVLAFGLNGVQRSCLANRCTLLDRPAGLPAHLHPYILKTATAQYLRPTNWSAMVWMDSDMVAVGPLGENLNVLLS